MLEADVNRGIFTRAATDTDLSIIEGMMGRKSTIKSLEWPEMTVAIVGNNGIVRHLYVSESELDGKTTNTKIGVLQVWQKQDSGWKLLARAGIRLGAA